MHETFSSNSPRNTPIQLMSNSKIGVNMSGSGVSVETVNANLQLLVKQAQDLAATGAQHDGSHGCTT